MKRRLFTSLALFLLIAALPLSAMAASYIVRPGDTLGAIANANNTTVSELVRINNLANPDRIFVGQSITLPGTASQPVTYTVRAGDTLARIAAAHNTTVAHLVSLNNISNPNLITPGQVLRVSGSIVQTVGAIAIPWPQVNNLYARGTRATVIDVQTGRSFQVVRLGGYNHADVEPATAADTAIMKGIYGGTWSWNRRAVVVVVNGQRIAGSMNGMPHGGANISNNNFAGHFCIHFLNSRTHGSNRVDAAHQAAVQAAIGK